MFDTLISREEVQAHLGDAGWRIVDCRFDLKDTERGRRDFAVSHVPGAVYAHLDDDLSSPITPTTGRHPLPEFGSFVRTVRRLGIGNTTQVVVYDDSIGSIAVRLWWMLRNLGHHSVALMDGGWPAWVREGRPVTAEFTPPAESRFIPRSSWSEDVSTPRLQAELQSRSCLLLDCRTAERYRGEREPIDPIAGHVPGALNRPYLLNVDTNGDFLPPEELRKAYVEQIRGTDPSRVVHMCGSGVTACHNLLAMEMAGLPGSRLYSGSWSEWIRDPQRPVGKA